MGAKQSSLFGTPDAYGGIAPVALHAYRDDPATSHQAAVPHEAAARIAKSGKVKQHREIALQLVKAMPSSTAHELRAGVSGEERGELVNSAGLEVRPDRQNRHRRSEGHSSGGGPLSPGRVAPPIRSEPGDALAFLLRLGRLIRREER